MSTEQATLLPRPAYRRVDADIAVTVVLLVVASVGWWWAATAMDGHAMPGHTMPGMTDGAGASDGMAGMEMAGDVMSSSASAGIAHTTTTLAAFLVAWVAMMAAMMLPAVSPVVGLYRRAVEKGRAAPLPVFLLGYLLVWTVPGIPVYWAWRELAMPLSDGEVWAGRLAAGALLAAAAWQLGPVKAVCLKHCRSPLSFFMQHGGGLRRPVTALRLGLAHGGFCLGCCWLLMVVLVALGTMNLYWMAALAAVIFAEKVTRYGERVAQVTAVALAGLGVFLLIDPTAVASLT